MSFSPGSLLGGHVLAWRVASQLLRPVSRGDSPVVQRKSVQIFAFHFSSLFTTLYSIRNTDEMQVPSHLTLVRVFSGPKQDEPLPLPLP